MHLSRLFPDRKRRLAWLLQVEIYNTNRDLVTNYWYPGYCESATYTKWLEYPLRYIIPSIELHHKKTVAAFKLEVSKMMNKYNLTPNRTKDIVYKYEQKTKYLYGCDFAEYTDLQITDAELCCIWGIIMFVQFLSKNNIPNDYYLIFPDENRTYYTGTRYG